jgi:hypothetical protein
VESSVKISGMEVFDKLKKLGDRGKYVCAHALNRTLTGIKTDIVKEVRTEWNIKAGDLRKAVKLERARPNNLLGLAIVSGRERVPLFAFSPRPKTPFGAGIGKRPKVGPSIMMKRGRRITLKGAFVQTIPRSGHTSIFKREGASRLPINKMTGPYIAQMLKTPGVNQRINAQAQERFRKNLAHDIEFEIQKQGLK